MIDFRLDEPVDFAFILLGSLYTRNTTELLSHFDAVSRALKHGGLYLLDWCVQFALPTERTESWEMSRDDITVKTTYRVKPINPVEQTVEETITLEGTMPAPGGVTRKFCPARDLPSRISAIDGEP